MIGGILVGQSLIEAVRIQKTVRQLADYNHGVRQFLEKYRFYPGDYPRAVETLGAATNGDGNRIMGIGSANRYTAVPAEESNSYQHLTKAGMVNFPPAPAAGLLNYSAGFIQAGQNTPELAFEGVGILPLMLALSPCGGSALCFEIGGWISGNASDTLTHPGLNGPATMALDAKLDDGKPDSGNFVSYSSSIASTVNQNLSCKSGGAYPTAAETGCFSRMVLFPFGY